jgi:shikimate 5-dehydrogenase
MARNFQWRVIDEKVHFQKTTGYSIAEYVDEHGVEAYGEEAAIVLSSVLVAHPTRCIIVCNSSCILTAAGRSILSRRCEAGFPVVHVVRDAHVLESYLRSRWDGDVIRILREQEPVYLACSNYTFYNVDDSSGASKTDDLASVDPNAPLETVNGEHSRPSLSLKRLEWDFLHYLANVYGHPIPNLHVDNGMNASPVYALSIPFDDMDSSCLADLETFGSCADVLHVRTDRLIRGYLARRHDRRGSLWEYIVAQLAHLRRRTGRPILYHVVAPPSSLTSGQDHQDADYVALWQLGLRVVVDHMAVDLSQLDALPLGSVLLNNKGTSHTRRRMVVGCYHDSNPTQTGSWGGFERLQWYHKAKRLGCDIVHFTQPALTHADNAAALTFANTLNALDGPRVSAYNTGRLGRLSQCLNKQLTLVRHHRSNASKDDADLITIPQAQKALFGSLAYEPLRFAVLGFNTEYSVAPVVHGSAFSAYGMPHVYSIAQIASVDSPGINELLKDHHLGGLGLSAPFKTAILPLLHSMSSEARSIGAVNTIIPIRTWEGHHGSSDGDVDLAEQRHRAGPVLGLHGTNTDWMGIQSCIWRHLSPVNAVSGASTALIIGAGGMARAAVYAALRSGIRTVCIYNRTVEHAEKLVADITADSQSPHPSWAHTDAEVFRPPPPPLHFEILDSHESPWPKNIHLPTIVVNCTPIPSTVIQPSPPAIPASNPDQSLRTAVSVPSAWLRSPTGGVYLELAYNSTTPSPELYRICSEKNRGWIGVSGLEIFVEVASAQFELWTGRRAPKCVMNQQLHVYLQGM